MHMNSWKIRKEMWYAVADQVCPAAVWPSVEGVGPSREPGRAELAGPSRRARAPALLGPSSARRSAAASSAPGTALPLQQPGKQGDI